MIQMYKLYLEAKVSLCVCFKYAFYLWCSECSTLALLRHFTYLNKPVSPR